MAKLEKEVQKFIKSYQTDKGQFWRTVIPDGHGSQIRKQGFLTKTDATDYAVKKYLNVLNGAKGIRSINTVLQFKDFSFVWLDGKRKNGLAESSAMRYQSEIEIRLNPYFGPFKLNELEKIHLRNFINEQQELGVGTGALRYAVMTFKGIMKAAEAEDLISNKGITLVPTPRKKKFEAEFWDNSQIHYFLNASKESLFHDLWKMTLFSGMRAGEIAGLQWDCIQMDRQFGGYTGVIEVRRTYNQKTRQMQETTKNGDRRIIPILPEVRELLLKLRENLSGAFVFGGQENLDSSHFSRQLAAELKKHPTLPQISFHKLRHSFCSYLDSTGMNRRIISEIMGHRTLATTDRYSHVNNQMLGVEMNRWLENQNQQKTNNLRAVNF